MMSSMEINREKAIDIIKDRTDLRLIAYQEVIDTFETSFERRNMNMINYIKRLSNLLTDDIKVLNSYELEFIEEDNLVGYWDCEKIKNSIIVMMIKLNELI